MATPPTLTTVNKAGGPTGATVNYIESSFMQTSYRADGQSFVRHVQVVGADEEKFSAAMGGYTFFDNTVVAPTSPLKRFPPEAHPRKTWANVKMIDFVRELGEPTTAGPGSTLQYGGTLLSGGIELALTYEPTPGVLWLYDNQLPAGLTHEAWRYVKVWEKYDIEQRIIPLNVLYFNATGTAVPSPGTKLVPSSTLFIEWYQVPALLDASKVPQLPGNLQNYW